MKEQSSTAVMVGTESFYVISHNDTELNALAKYNLKVGCIYTTDGELESTISSNEEGYGMQDENAKEYVDVVDRYIGIVAFSNQKGWPYENNETIRYKK